MNEETVDWAGRTFGQLTSDERRRVTRAAAARMQDELTAAASAIGRIMDQAAGPERTAPDFRLGDRVRFPQGDETGTMLDGSVVREPWGREGTVKCVSIRTIPDERMFARQVTAVELVETVESIYERLRAGQVAAKDMTWDEAEAAVDLAQGTQTRVRWRNWT
jgi:hypothetical protein